MSNGFQFSGEPPINDFQQGWSYLKPESNFKQPDEHNWNIQSNGLYPRPQGNLPMINWALKDYQKKYLESLYVNVFKNQ